MRKTDKKKALVRRSRTHGGMACRRKVSGQTACGRTSGGLAARRIVPSALFLASMLALTVLLSSCGGATVTMKELKFDPDTITIKKGDTVTWNNEDRRDRQIMSGHPPVMTDDFMSPVLVKGESWSHTFDSAGEYAYHDMQLPGQVGVVIVEE